VFGIVPLSLTLGGYGLFGFEFFTARESPVTYFLQAGGLGSNGDANGLAGSPAYANGFVIETGIRWYPY
jgi:hypothetical protein